MFEHVSEPLLSKAAFLQRFVASTGIGVSVIAVSLLIGMIGFRSVEGLNWLDAFLNASMLLGGMGPLEHDRNSAGKLFEGLYALYCGLAVISVTGIILAPVAHRFLHKMHRQHRDREQISLLRSFFPL